MKAMMELVGPQQDGWRKIAFTLVDLQEGEQRAHPWEYAPLCPSGAGAEN